MSGKPADAEPAHYVGHRARLRARLREAGADAVADYELLELVLFRAIPRRDVKPLAKALIARFGSFAEAIAARPERLAEIDGMTAASIDEFKILEAGARASPGARSRSGCRSARGAKSSTTAARRWRSPTARNSASCFSTSATA